MTKPAWKKLEDDVKAYFKVRMETEPYVYLRLNDTRSAQGFLPSQPADHLIHGPAGAVLLETKYSAVHATLRSCFSDAVDDNQIAHMRVWLRAGAFVLILFQGTQGYELWDGGHCAWCRINSKVLDPEYIFKRAVNISEVFSHVYVRYPKTEKTWRIF